MKNFSIISSFLLLNISCSWVENQISALENKSSVHAIDTVLYSTPTKISFLDTMIDLGRVKAGDEKAIVFRYKNIGDHPLVLFSVSPGCGCTIADYSREPLMPGGMDSIRAKFDSKGKEGPYQKAIKVNSNSEEKIHTLNFKVNVIK